MASESSNIRDNSCIEGTSDNSGVSHKINYLSTTVKLGQNFSRKKIKSKNRPMVKATVVNGLQVTDERLKAYGINPKKFKNKLKHRKKL